MTKTIGIVLFAALASCGACTRGVSGSPQTTSATPSDTEQPHRSASGQPLPAARTNPPVINDRVIYDEIFGGTSRLKLIETLTAEDGLHCCSTVLRDFLVDREDPTKQVQLDSVPDDYEFDYHVDRVTNDAVLVCRVNSNGNEAGCISFFVDAGAKRLINRVAFDPNGDVSFENDVDAQRTLGISSAELALLRDESAFTAPTEVPAAPALFDENPLRQSTYRDFVRERLGRVKDGYEENETTIEERVGAWQPEADGFWFGKAFYDGEGATGVGAVGFLSRSGRYSFLTIPLVRDWSVVALTVEPEMIWLGRAHYGEYVTGSGGLLQYNRKTHASHIYPITGVIRKITHVGNGIFVVANGLWVIRAGRMTRFHMEPEATGRLVVVTEIFER